MEKQIYEKSLKVFVDGKYHNQKESLRSRISESSLFKLKWVVFCKIVIPYIIAQLFVLVFDIVVL